MSFGLDKLSSLFKHDGARARDGAVIGVDVGASSIKIVQLHEQKGNPVLDTYGELQLGPYDGVDIGRTVRLRPDRLIEAFVDIVREAGARAEKVSVAISYNATFTTMLTLNTEDPAKAQSMLTVEARKYIPVPLSDVTIDWVPSPTAPGSKGMRGILVAIHNEALARYDAMIKGVNLPVAAREIELFSTLRTALTANDASVCVIDIGAGSTKVYLIEENVFRRSHSLELSGLQITSAIEKSLVVPFRDAEDMKRRLGLGVIQEHPECEKAITDILNRGFREIHTVIHRYQEETNAKVEKVVLTGGGSLLRGMTLFAHDALSLPVQVAHPFAKVSYPAFLEDTLIEAGPSFAVALGVALRGLDS
jgi:type IV pilus assembly protein PilM